MRKRFLYSMTVLALTAGITLTTGCNNSENKSGEKVSTEEENKETDKESDKTTDKADEQGKENTDNKDNVINVGDVSDKESLEIYDSLFNIENEVKVTLDIPEEELKKVQEDYDKYDRRHSKSPIYRKCNMTITIDGKEHYIEEVGFRMKGNTSRDDFYSESRGVYSLIHFKFSFNETFDDEKYYGEDAKVWESEEERQARKDRRFATLKGLEMKWNREVDGTYLRETYAFKMYRDFGCLAPNNTIGQCVVNNQNWGVYKIYEPVDKHFIERNLPQEEWGGDLYKCSWGSGPADYTHTNGRAGVEDEDLSLFFTYDLKTNKKESQHEDLNRLVDTINKSGVTKEELEQVVEMDNWLMFSAISYMLGMPDDLRNNYNNHYVYFKKNTGKAIFIAYDCDLALGIEQWNPTGKYMTETNPYSGYAYGNNDGQQNKLVTLTLLKISEFEEQYTKALNDVLNSKWMTFENFKELYDIIEPHYKDVTKPDLSLRRKDVNEFELSIEDKYMGGTKRNGNMKIEDYLVRMVQNAKAHMEE